MKSKKLDVVVFFSDSSPQPSVRLSPSRRKRSIKFDKVTVREYELTTGDNPSCSSGVPISLSWKYNPVHEEFAIDEYEKNHASRGNPIQLSADDRYKMLTMQGVQIPEIIEAQKE